MRAALALSRLEESAPNPEYRLLASGAEFLDDLEDRLRTAEDHVVIQNFLWRNDQSGQRVAVAALEAADRDVKIFTVKDRIAAFFEYGQRDGQSFFHDRPNEEPIAGTHSLRTVYPQAQAFATLYGNPIKPPSKNPLREALTHHPNVHVMDQYKIYDHSKVVIIDGKTAYMGGIGFGDEFTEEDENGNTWLDFMLRTDREEDVRNILNTLAGNSHQVEGSNLHLTHDTHLTRNGSSLHEDLLEFIGGTRERLTVVMAFLGVPEYIDQLTEVVNSGRQVELITARAASSHRWRNLHFIKRLIRQTRGHHDNLRIALTPMMVHAKILERDGEVVRHGSQNMCMDNRVMAETGIVTERPEIIEAFRDAIQRRVDERLFVTGDGIDELDREFSWHRIIVPSRLEYVGVKLQTLMAKLRETEIRRARAECQDLLKSIITHT